MYSRTTASIKSCECVMKYLIFPFLSLLSVCGGVCHAAPIDVRVGIITSLSGNWAAFGDMTVKGLTLAKDALESEGSLKLNFDIQDSHEEASGFGAVSAYRALRAKGINLFIGPAGTPGGLALIPVPTNEPVIVISPSVAVETFNKAGKNIFNSRGAYEVASRAIANRAFVDGARRMAIFASQQPYESTQGNAFGEEFTKLGGKIVIRVDPLPESTDLRTEALRIAQAKPDGVFFSVYNQLAVAAKEIKQLRYQGLRYALIVDRSRFEGARGSLDGLVFAKLGETNPAFIKTFYSKFGRDPDYPADFAYDGLMALGKSILEAKNADIGSILPKLLEVKFNGASGEFGFNSDGGAVRQPQAWKVRGEEFIRLFK